MIRRMRAEIWKSEIEKITKKLVDETYFSNECENSNYFNLKTAEIMSLEKL